MGMDEKSGGPQPNPPPPTPHPPSGPHFQAVIISGLSGSGMSSAGKAFEDLGYFSVDNLPPQLIPTFLELMERSSSEFNRAAIVVDGEVAVLAVGEESDGVRVVAIDEDTGVRVREADGTETVLRPPEPRS